MQGVPTSEGSTGASMSAELLHRQDADYAVEYLKAKYPYIIENEVPSDDILRVIGNLLRENRMLVNLAKSETSERIPHLQTEDVEPPYSEQPKFEHPCRSVDIAAGRIKDPKLPSVGLIDLNPATIRRIQNGDSFRYRKNNAGRIR